MSGYVRAIAKARGAERMTDFDPNDPHPHKRMDWALRHYWWAIIPLVVFLYMMGVELDSRGYAGKTIVQVGFIVFFAVAFVYDRRAKRKKAGRGQKQAR